MAAINGMPCLSTTWRRDDLVQCVAPPGVGAGRSLSVTVAAQTGSIPAAVSYRGIRALVARLTSLVQAHRLPASPLSWQVSPEERGSPAWATTLAQQTRRLRSCFRA